MSHRHIWNTQCFYYTILYKSALTDLRDPYLDFRSYWLKNKKTGEIRVKTYSAKVPHYIYEIGNSNTVTSSITKITSSLIIIVGTNRMYPNSTSLLRQVFISI